MVRRENMSEADRKYHEELECPKFETRPWVEGPPLSRRRVAIVSTAGLHVWNVVFPIDRLRELADTGVIGSVAAFHYSFMGAHAPPLLEQDARRLAGIMKGDNVDAVLLIPV